MRLSMSRVALALLFALALPAGAARASGIVEVKSPGGVTAWLIEDHSLPLVALRFSFEGGSASFPAKLFPPTTSVSLHTSRFIAISGFTHGPPASLHPAQLKIDISSPSRLASSAE